MRDHYVVSQRERETTTGNDHMGRVRERWRRPDICLASHQARLNTRSFYSGGCGEGDCTQAEIRVLLDNAGHRITRCNVNYANLGQVSRHVCQLTLLVIDSIDSHSSSAMLVIDPSFTGNHSARSRLATKSVKMHRHRGDGAVLRYNLYTLPLRSPEPNSFLVYIILWTPTQILVVIPLIYTLNVDITLSSISPRNLRSTFTEELPASCFLRVMPPTQLMRHF